MVFVTSIVVGYQVVHLLLYRLQDTDPLRVYYTLACVLIVLSRGAWLHYWWDQLKHWNHHLALEPISIITTAIVLGIAAGAKSTTAQAVRDAYTALRMHLFLKFGNKGEAAKAVKGVEAKPESDARKGMLKEELEAAGAGKDQEVVAHATALLKLLEQHTPGATGGLVGQINAAGGKAVVVHTNYASSS
jgi:hypothetical protein